MPTISEAELSEGQQGEACTLCPEFEGAVWLCGEGWLCERCFSKLAGVAEEDVFLVEDAEVPSEYTARAKANLIHQRGQDVENQA